MLHVPTPSSPTRRPPCLTGLCGTRTPRSVHWPAGIRARGEVRDQFVHAVDVMPTILGACGVEAPEVVDGASQQPFDGASFAASFDDAEDRKSTRLNSSH